MSKKRNERGASPQATAIGERSARVRANGPPDEARDARRCYGEPVDDLQLVVDRYLRGQISAPVAAMELLLATSDVEFVMRTLPALRGESARIRELSALLDRHAAGCSTIVALLRSGLDSPEPASCVEAGLARTRRLFDHSVTQSEEASVAFYSLGSAELLADATAEVVTVLTNWRVLSRERDALEIGCGIGRFLVALAPRLRAIVGLDIAPNMVEAAQRRIAHAPNARAMLTTGHDLSQFSERSFDLVLSVDAFPYLVQAGHALVETHFREVSRVLRPGGSFVIFNFAYGRSREQDAREVRELGLASGLLAERVDQTPFRLWNAVGYQLFKR